MALVDGDHGVEKLLDLVLGFGEDHGWTNDYLEDHCFVAHYLMGTRLILNDYPGDDPVPAPLDCLLRVMKILAYSRASFSLPLYSNKEAPHLSGL